MSNEYVTFTYEVEGLHGGLHGGIEVKIYLSDLKHADSKEEVENLIYKEMTYHFKQNAQVENDSEVLDAWQKLKEEEVG